MSWQKDVRFFAKSIALLGGMAFAYFAVANLTGSHVPIWPLRDDPVPDFETIRANASFPATAQEVGRRALYGLPQVLIALYGIGTGLGVRWSRVFGFSKPSQG